MSVDTLRLDERTPMTDAVEDTLAGLSAIDLHDRFWAARGVQVVRPGVTSELIREAELFLLLDPRDLVIFRLRQLLDDLVWLNPELLMVRMTDRREQGYREHIVTDSGGRFVRFQRSYTGRQVRLNRAALIRNLDLAQCWREAPSAIDGWRLLRQRVPRTFRSTIRARARVYDRTSPTDTTDFLEDLLRTWRDPSATIERFRRVGKDIWCDIDGEVDPEARVVGPVWIGAGRQIAGGGSFVGPALLWDKPDLRPPPPRLAWEELEPVESFNRPLLKRRHGALYDILKRGFDIVFAALALLVVLPLFPLIMLAIWLEDGRPIFFAHQRETLGGRAFGCLKFRSMRKNADKFKEQLQKQNKADGPQFFIENDPRVTRVGYLLRKYNLDELPQFINVLRGHMSVVGPRPSPHRENQFCPAWREARLSVRPGITGLWQVMRSRIAGRDFQEWIKYDIEYVENSSLWLDFKILWRTVFVLLKVK